MTWRLQPAFMTLAKSETGDAADCGGGRVSVSMCCMMVASQDFLNGVGHNVSTTMTKEASSRSLRASGQLFNSLAMHLFRRKRASNPPPTFTGYQLRVCTTRHVISAPLDLAFVVSPYRLTIRRQTFFCHRNTYKLAHQNPHTRILP